MSSSEDTSERAMQAACQRMLLLNFVPRGHFNSRLPLASTPPRTASAKVKRRSSGAAVMAPQVWPYVVCLKQLPSPFFVVCLKQLPSSCFVLSKVLINLIMAHLCCGKAKNN